MNAAGHQFQTGHTGDYQTAPQANSGGIHLPPMPLTPTEQNRQRENDNKGIAKIGSNAMIHMNRGSADANAHGQGHKSFSMHNKRD